MQVQSFRGEDNQASEAIIIKSQSFIMKMINASNNHKLLVKHF